MTLEQQVTNLELSKKLKELGVPQESLFYWWGNREETEIKIAYRTEILEGMIPVGIKEKGYCSAFTASELGEMLPEKIGNSNRDWQHLHIWSDKKTIDYMRNTTGGSLSTFPPMFAETEADARAKMLIYLKENKLI